MTIENSHFEGTQKTTYDIHSKIMLISIFSLLFVILFIVILHIYARYTLRHPRRNPVTTFIQHSVTPQFAESKSGLDPTVISLLPSFQVRHVEGQDDHIIIECAVCLSLLEEDDLARRLPNCNHDFHMACIDRWLSSQSTCPICRSEVTPRLTPLGREPPNNGGDHLAEVVVVIAPENEDDDNNNSNSNDMQSVIIRSDNNNNVSSSSSSSKIINNGSGSSSSFRLSSFRKFITRERSSSFSRLQATNTCGEIDDQQRQV